MGRHPRQVGDLGLVVRCDDAYARQAESLLDVVARFRGKGILDGEDRDVWAATAGEGET